MSALRAGVLAVLASCIAACATPSGSATPDRARGEPAPRSESEAVMAAEMALREGDCRKASESYLAAARLSSEPSVAMRASQLALGCSQYTVARTAAARWRELEPWSGEAALAAAVVALKRYDLAESREALTAWRDSGSAGSQDPLQFAALLASETDVTALYRIFGEVLVGPDPTAEVLLAHARLAMSAHNMEVAMESAQRAAVLDTGMIEAQVIVLRALSVLGEHTAAIAGVRALDPAWLQGEDAFLLADLLVTADRQGDARRELLLLAAADETRIGAERRLFATAMRNGNLDEAEQRLATLMEDRGTVLAILYFAQLAERRGDLARAIQTYALLDGSSLTLMARASAARLFLKQGDRETALGLLDEFAEQNPDQAIEAGSTRAQLLAQHGDMKAAITGLDALRAAYPDHPDLEYQRAIILESGGRARDAIAQLERALRNRPDDPQLQNALGYTLADHRQRLPEAERLVRAALEVSPDNPAIQDSLGWVLYRRGQVAEALPVLAQAWRNSGDGEVGAHYGEVLWHSGDEGQARYVWLQVLNAEPDHKHVRETMARLTGEDAPAR